VRAPLFFGHAAYAIHAKTKDDNARHFSVSAQFGFDRREFGKGFQNLPQHRAALGVIADFFIDAERQRAAPMEIVVNAINLEAGARMFSQRIDFLANQRMAVNVAFNGYIINGNYVSLAFIDATEATQSTAFNDIPRVALAQASGHSNVLYRDHGRNARAISERPVSSVGVTYEWALSRKGVRKFPQGGGVTDFLVCDDLTTSRIYTPQTELCDYSSS
jgi:hypothetical protein